MKKKILMLVCAFCFIIPAVLFGLTACKAEKEYYDVYIANKNILFGEPYKLKVPKGSSYKDIKVRTREGYTLSGFIFRNNRPGIGKVFDESMDEKIEPDKGKNSISLYTYYSPDDKSAELTIDGLTAPYNLRRGVTVYDALKEEGINLNAANTCGWFNDTEFIKPIDGELLVPERSYVSAATKRCRDLEYSVEFSYDIAKIIDTSEDLVIPQKHKNVRITRVEFVDSDGSVGICDSKITIPGTVKEIKGNSLTANWRDIISINFPEGLVEFSANLNGCSINEIKIPSTLTTFTGKLNGAKLESIIVAEGNAVYTSKRNLNAILENETGNLILGCKNTTLVGVKHICAGAFEGVDFGTNVLDFPIELESIGARAFYGCKGISRVILWGGTHINKYAFTGSDLTRIYIPDSVTHIYKSAFEGIDYNNAIIYCEVAEAPEDYGYSVGPIISTELEWNYSDKNHQIATKYGYSLADFLSENPY